MGRDKALLPLLPAGLAFNVETHGQSLNPTWLEWGLIRLGRCTRPVALSGSAGKYQQRIVDSPSLSFLGHVPCIEDSIVDRGPLAGLVAIFEWAHSHGAAWVLTIPVDVPLVPEAVLAGLARAAIESVCDTPIYLASGDQEQGLCAVWPVNRSLEYARPALLEGRLAIFALHRALGSTSIQVRDLCQDQELAAVALTNANTRHEVDAIQTAAFKHRATLVGS